LVKKNEDNQDDPEKMQTLRREWAELEAELGTDALQPPEPAQ
jgi:hypothetical protein